MNRSIFPNEIDKFIEVVDIPPQRVRDHDRLHELQRKDGKTQIEIDEMNSLRHQLAPYLIDTETWNKLCDCIVNMENFTKETFFEYYRYRGKYDNEIAYKIFNSVTYTNGHTYLLYNSKNYRKGIIPTNEDYWIQMTQKGDKGDKGDNAIGLIPKGSWKDKEDYLINSCVEYQGSVYECIKNNKGKPPVENPDCWRLLLAKGITVTTIRSSITLPEDTNIIKIPISFNPVDDRLSVHKNTGFLAEDDAYRIVNGNWIEIIGNNTWKKGDFFHFEVLKNVEKNISLFDGTLIKEGSVMIEALHPSVANQLSTIKSVNGKSDEKIVLTSEDISTVYREGNVEESLTNMTENIADITNNINEMKSKTDKFNTTSTNPTKTNRVNCEGYFYATRVFNMTYADYAENFSVVEKCEAGDVISIDPNTGKYVRSKDELSHYVIGVVSDEYAFCIGGTGEDTDTPIGMKGTLNVKVTGKGNIGDLLVTSKIPGVAKVMKKDEYMPGIVIGKCLKAFDFKDTVGKTRMLIMNC